MKYFKSTFSFLYNLGTIGVNNCLVFFGQYFLSSYNCLTSELTGESMNLFSLFSNSSFIWSVSKKKNFLETLFWSPSPRLIHSFIQEISVGARPCTGYSNAHDRQNSCPQGVYIGFEGVEISIIKNTILEDGKLYGKKLSLVRWIGRAGGNKEMINRGVEIGSLPTPTPHWEVTFQQLLKEWGCLGAVHSRQLE